MRVIVLCVVVLLQAMIYCAPASVIEPGVWNTNSNVFLAILPSLSTSFGQMPVTVNVRSAMMEHFIYHAGITAYNPVAKPVFGVIPKRPTSEHTTRNKNIVMAITTYRTILEVTTPDRYTAAKLQMEAALVSLGVPLNCTEKNPNLATGDCIAIAVANNAADQAFQYFRTDGMNQLGDANGRQYHRVNYTDTSNYQVKNTPTEFKKYDDWQPNTFIESLKTKSAAQTFVTPHLGLVRPFAINPRTYTFTDPHDTHKRNKAAYFAKIDDVLAEHALTANNDTRKVIIEFFDNKPLSFGTFVRYPYGSANGSRSFNIDNFVAIAPAL